jgi:carbamoyltransferase
MTSVLGISCFYHDSAAAIIVDGEIVAAAQEERFTRVKHDENFPSNAVHYCLREAGFENVSEVDYVGFYDKPLLKFERLLETYLTVAPRGYRVFLQSLPLWMRQKLWTKREILRGLKSELQRQLVFTKHHESHAASAFFPSPFEEAAILTLDGVGEFATSTIGVGRGNNIQMLKELHFPHSLGLLYSAFTAFCGFRVNSGEYKLMGLAPYGSPAFADVIREKIIDVKSDGSFRLNMDYFSYCKSGSMTSRKFWRLFGGPPRKPESEITQREMDLAASIQVVTNEIVLRIADHARKKTGLASLCLAGGVALNCVTNGQLSQSGIFDRIWVQPAAGDAGGSLGVAFFIWHQLLGNERQSSISDSMKGSLLGPRFSHTNIKTSLSKMGAKYHELANDDELCGKVAKLLSEEKVVGWFQGRMEFGPRSLGSRSILGDPRSGQMQRKMNLQIKFRESFRPFAPSVISERSADFFEPTGIDSSSPYMLVVSPVTKSIRMPTTKHAKRSLDSVNECRSTIPAVTHLDYSARIQTVDKYRNPLFRKLIEAFDERTGCPVVINTSFNVRGEPIVCTPEDAYRCFMATAIDVLAIGNFLLFREEQVAASQGTQLHVESFPLD